jgi:hypothetical protein
MSTFVLIGYAMPRSPGFGRIVRKRRFALFLPDLAYVLSKLLAPYKDA